MQEPVKVSRDLMEEARQPHWRTEGMDSDNTLHGQRRGLGLLSAAAPAKDGHRQRGLHGPPQTEGTSFSGFQCSEASGIGLTWYPSEMPRFAARCQLIHEVSAAVFRVSRFRTSLHSPLLRCESRTPSSVDNLHRTAAVETWTPKLGGICTLKHFDDWLLAISCLTDDDVLLLADGEAFHSMFPE